MSFRAIAGLLFLAVFAVVGFVGYRFVALNLGERTQLVLDLYFLAWQFSSPIPTIALLGAGFGAGVLLGAFFAGGRAVVLSRRVRRLEQELAFSGKSAPGEWR
jgi:uncharacterized integral membrane protein